MGYIGEAGNGADVGIRTVAGHAGAYEADVLHRSLEIAKESGISCIAVDTETANGVAAAVVGA